MIGALSAHPDEPAGARDRFLVSPGRLRREPGATTIAVRVLGEDGVLGLIAEDALADVIVCEGDPLEDVTALRSVRVVIKDGEVLCAG